MKSTRYNTATLHNYDQHIDTSYDVKGDAFYLEISATTLRKVIKELDEATKFCSDDEQVYFFRYNFSNGSWIEWVNPEIDRTKIHHKDIRITHDNARRQIMLARVAPSTPIAAPATAQLTLAF